MRRDAVAIATVRLDFRPPRSAYSIARRLLTYKDRRSALGLIGKEPSKDVSHPPGHVGAHPPAVHRDIATRAERIMTQCSATLVSVVLMAGCTAPSPTIQQNPCAQAGEGTTESPYLGDGNLAMRGILIAGTKTPVQGVTAKIVWKLTGDGAPRFEAEKENVKVPLEWGPVDHGTETSWDSNPGEDEWGTGTTFPSAGCWTINVSRGSDASRAYVVVT